WRFQPTLPRGERPPATSTPRYGPPGFNPRSRAGSDGGSAHAAEQVHVSTHAPARGATADKRPTLSDLRVSTHAPARGATIAYAVSWVDEKFQPTLPRGERRARPRGGTLA